MLLLLLLLLLLFLLRLELLLLALLLLLLALAPLAHREAAAHGGGRCCCWCCGCQRWGAPGAHSMAPVECQECGMGPSRVQGEASAAAGARVSISGPHRLLPAVV